MLSENEVDSLSHTDSIDDVDEIDIAIDPIIEEEKLTIGRANIIPLIEDNPAIDRKKILDNIMLMMGTRYKFSGKDSNGIDCSGFIRKVYLDAAGIDLPHSSKGQYSTGMDVERDNLKFGDLVFFATKRKLPSHVGIYVGDGLFAHASRSIGVTISILDSKYYKRRYLGAKRVVE